MESRRPLAPLLIGRGTLSDFRDMLRALETLDDVEYRFIVDGEPVDEGRAALVKLMADPESSTIVVNGCLFLNVASFRYLDFEPLEGDRWLFVLHADGSTLELVALPETGEDATRERPRLLALEEVPDFESLMIIDEDDDED